jgi:hypothetical protein
MRMTSPTKPKAPEIDLAAPMRDVLDALNKPDVSASREDKHAYASGLSRRLAVLMARALRPAFPNVHPTEDDLGHESPVGSSEGTKRLDVKVWDDTLGLRLLVSIKTYSFQDWDNKKQKAGRFSKNVKRNGLELKDEADVVHRRQPYSVMIAIMFVPESACLDGDASATSNDKGVSSFASMVRRLRVRTGRSLDPDDKRFERYDLTERLYIGLYKHEGPERGSVGFFDVKNAPPKTGVPTTGLLTLPQLIDEIKSLEHERNSTGIDWEVLTDEATEDEPGD